MVGHGTEHAKDTFELNQTIRGHPQLALSKVTLSSVFCWLEWILLALVQSVEGPSQDHLRQSLLDVEGAFYNQDCVPLSTWLGASDAPDVRAQTLRLPLWESWTLLWL